MQILMRSNDPVLLSAVDATLRAEGIEGIVLDAYTSAAEGSIGVLPRRVMVSDDDLSRARRLLHDTGMLDPDAGSAPPAPAPKPQQGGDHPTWRAWLLRAWR